MRLATISIDAKNLARNALIEGALDRGEHTGEAFLGASPSSSSSRRTRCDRLGHIA